MQANEALELVKIFASTWLSLEAYDKSALPRSGVSKKHIKVTADELVQTLSELKQKLVSSNQASDVFGQERIKGAVIGIVSNVFQSVFGQDAYKTVEEKAAHLLYFFVKNHPFTDGNKRSGAFAFVWFLNKTKLFHRGKMTPEALTALTLLVAENNPK